MVYGQKHDVYNNINPCYNRTKDYCPSLYHCRMRPPYGMLPAYLLVKMQPIKGPLIIEDTRGLQRRI